MLRRSPQQVRGARGLVLEQLFSGAASNLPGVQPRSALGAGQPAGGRGGAAADEVLVGDPDGDARGVPAALLAHVVLEGRARGAAMLSFTSPRNHVAKPRPVSFSERGACFAGFGATDGFAVKTRNSGEVGWRQPQATRATFNVVAGVAGAVGTTVMRPPARNGGNEKAQSGRVGVHRFDPAFLRAARRPERRTVRHWRFGVGCQMALRRW